jgi:hypothetical protein
MPGDGESRKTGLRTLGRLSGGNQGAQVADELPALRLRQLGPDGHSVPNYAVGKDHPHGLFALREDHGIRQRHF